MKRILTILALVATFITSSFTASAQTVKKDFDLKGFSGIDISNDFRATVTKSDTYSVNVEIDGELAPYLDVRLSKDVLIVELRNAPTKLTLLKNKVMDVSISMPQLRSISMNGTSKLVVEDAFDLGNGDISISTGGTSEVKQFEIHARNAALSLSGASKVNLNGDFINVDIQSSGTSRVVMEADAEELKVKSSGTAVSEVNGKFDTMDFELSGTSNVTLKGEADEMNAVASSAGSVDALRMPVRAAKVRLSGAGICKAYIKESLEVQCTGASTCSYKTDGEIKLDLKEIARTATLKKL